MNIVKKILIKISKNIKKYLIYHIINDIII
ncbi:MAG: Unknown protein [uncultured Campylobacterales bacterium]|uniref:Uncharacterized protein n=1 Tax=uncultured Campylobacterales bacterium TaxID=352960 RepID=A0A6S6SKV5_9BACT|nr:MAG: Unknown protein [uncultured Campylobacterales bacterium]